MRNLTKNHVKKIIVMSIFVGLIIFSNILVIHDSIPLFGDNNNNKYDKDGINIYSSDGYDLSSYIISGSGTSLETRIYAVNQSTSNDNPGGFFTINAPTTPMRLSEGAFNFTFENSYITDHIIEDKSALYPYMHVEQYEMDIDAFGTGNLIVEHALSSNTSVTKAPVDSVNSTYWRFESSERQINFSISTEFADPDYERVQYDRNQIMALILDVVLSVNISNVNLNLFMKNNSGSWVLIMDNINLATGIQSFRETIINTNLNFINASDITQVKFSFSHSSLNFKVDLNEYMLYSVMGLELPISTDEYVALEFDLRGEASQVNGFHVWIRTLNLSDAAGKFLNITLYRANQAFARTTTSLRDITNSIRPDNNYLIDSILVPYMGDELTHFDFNLENTANLPFNNYFIVIKSDAEVGTYSLVTLSSSYGENPAIDQIDHQLKRTINNGDSWINAQITLPAGNQQYEHTTPYLDASSFKLNITRGYMPSDFNNTLTMEDVTLHDVAMTFLPFKNNDPYYGNEEWGQAICYKDVFSTHVEDQAGVFQLNLIWDTNISSGFDFNVSYHVTAYVVGDANSYYQVKYNGIPTWSLNFSLDTNVGNWNYTSFCYLFPNDMTVHNLTNPNYHEILLNSTNGQEVLPENTSYNRLVVNSTINGWYSLNLTSTNYLTSNNQVHSYINYNGHLWETKGFMYGDDITVGIDVQDHQGKAPISGNANVTLFFNDVYNASLINSSGIISQDGSFLTYDFGNQTLLHVDSDVLLNNDYYLGFFWTNGTAIGCRKLQILLHDYKFSYGDFTYNINENLNKLVISLSPVYPFNLAYNALVATVNETTGSSKPEFPIILSNLNEKLEYFHPDIGGGTMLSINLNSFKQSENILNPEESINVKIDVTNLETFMSLNLKVKVQLVSYANDQWIIAENTSSIQKLDPGNSNEFDISLTIPEYNDVTKEWLGINAPIRRSGAKTIVTIYYADRNEIFGNIFECDNVSLLIDKLENDFEGYIIAVKDKRQSENIFVSFSRNECLYNQTGYDTTVITNYYNEHYSSIYEDLIETFSFKMASIFEEIITVPGNIDDEEQFNLTSVLKTEFGDLIPGETVTCQYKNDIGNWVNIPGNYEDTTDQNGKIEFLINTIGLNLPDNFKIRLIWNGNDTILNKTQEFDIVRNPSVASLSISLSSSPTIYKGYPNQIMLKFTNTGQLTLSILINNISVKINELTSLDYTIFYTKILQNFIPGQSIVITVQIYLPLTNLDSLHLNISIITEAINVYEIISFTAIYPPELPNLSIIIAISIVLSIILLCVSTVLFRRHVKIKISKSLEEPAVKEIPRRGRYVKPSELESLAMAKEQEKLKSEKERKIIEQEIHDEKPMTDLDSLLVETGIEKDTKKPQLTRSTLKKWNLDKLRDYCKKNNIKFSSKTTKSDLIEKILSKNK